MVVHGEPELRAGRALLLAAVDHLEGRGERGDLADCAEQSLPSTPSQRISRDRLQLLPRPPWRNWEKNSDWHSMLKAEALGKVTVKHLSLGNEVT